MQNGMEGGKKGAGLRMRIRKNGCLSYCTKWVNVKRLYNVLLQLWGVIYGSRAPSPPSTRYQVYYFYSYKKKNSCGASVNCSVSVNFSSIIKFHCRSLIPLHFFQGLMKLLALMHKLPTCLRWAKLRTGQQAVGHKANAREHQADMDTHTHTIYPSRYVNTFINLDHYTWATKLMAFSHRLFHRVYYPCIFSHQSPLQGILLKSMDWVMFRS